MAFLGSIFLELLLLENRTSSHCCGPEFHISAVRGSKAVIFWPTKFVGHVRGGGRPAIAAKTKDLKVCTSLTSEED